MEFGSEAVTRRIGIAGINFTLDGKSFYWQGLSFFNALYNPYFNKDDEARDFWLAKFRDNGITVLRVFAQWDLAGPLGITFVDAGYDRVLFTFDGKLCEGPLANLKALSASANRRNMVIELVVFMLQSQRHLPSIFQKNAMARMAEEMLPYRNVVFQIWNEHSEDVELLYQLVKGIDSERLVTNAPVGLGDETDNRLLDYLSPHTTRSGKFWVKAPKEIKHLIDKFKKPVVDDEPARTGMAAWGGRPDSEVWQHIRHIDGVRAIGGHHNYHGDFYHYGYGSVKTPPTGIPDPDYSPFHRQVFDHLKKLDPGDPQFY